MARKRRTDRDHLLAEGNYLMALWRASARLGRRAHWDEVASELDVSVRTVELIRSRMRARRRAEYALLRDIMPGFGMSPPEQPIRGGPAPRAGHGAEFESMLEAYIHGAVSTRQLAEYLGGPEGVDERNLKRWRAQVRRQYERDIAPHDPPWRKMRVRTTTV